MVRTFNLPIQFVVILRFAYIIFFVLMLGFKLNQLRVCMKFLSFLILDGFILGVFFKLKLSWLFVT